MVAANAKQAGSAAEATALPRWLDRVGAALASPRLALSSSDSPAARGRASSDITLLLFVALVARETQLFASAAWMLVDGDWAGAITVILAGAQKYLLVAILLLLAGAGALWILSGKRRSMADDFDLICVCLIPLVVIEIANALLFAFGLNIHPAGIVVGYAWFALLWGLAFLQTRSRGDKSQ